MFLSSDISSEEKLLKQSHGVFRLLESRQVSQRLEKHLSLYLLLCFFPSSQVFHLFLSAEKKRKINRVRSKC